MLVGMGETRRLFVPLEKEVASFRERGEMFVGNGGYRADSLTRSRRFSWTAFLECLHIIIMALQMGSCFSFNRRLGRPYSPLAASKKRFRDDEQLQSIPGKMFVNGASKMASLFTQKGKKGTNQDAMIVWENFASRSDTVFCGVFDGHGPCGHMVAAEVRDSLPLKLNARWNTNSNSNLSKENGTSTAGSMNPEGATSMPPEIFTTLKDAFRKAFRVMDRELKAHLMMDCVRSGTTAVTLVKQGKDLVIGNVGDSRAILATRDDNDCLKAVQLTIDLKPNLPKEAARIRRCKGRVFALQNEPKVARIWLPNYDAPGLAMARAFGDFCLKDFGLISVPDVTYRRLTERDEFLVLATDGIWDVLSNKEVVEIVASSPSRSTAARFLVESATRAWKYRCPRFKVDDCAVVCLFLDADSSNCVYSHAMNGGTTKTAGSVGPNRDCKDPPL